MFSSDAPSCRRPQNTSSPTFHTPPWSTAVPVAPLATVVPAAERSYFTFACVGEVSVTESTFEVTADASGLPENALTAEVNVEPFSSNWMRLLLGVEELKNASQLVVISATAEEEPPLDVAEAVLEADAAVDDGVAGGVLLLPELGLLEHAAIAVANARPSAGASKIRRAMCWNRIRCASLVRVGFGPLTG
jgi:hypothetical protein